MRLDEWRHFFVSEWNRDFVEPLLPSLGDRVRIRLRHPRTDRVSAIWLRYQADGSDLRIPMQPKKGGEAFQWWEVSALMSESRLRYGFVAHLSDGTHLFITRGGVSSAPPTEERDWVILADFGFPDWVPESVFYQIFPDRFRKGNPALGVRTDEYSFAGGRTIAMAWDRVPLEYEQGRCLDFFNGDLEGIRIAIPYFRELGVNALYLNPIFEARTTHRYDCVDYFNVDRHLGGNRALERLSKALHRHQIRLIVDVSINHVGIEHPWVKRALADRRNPERKMFYFNSKGQIQGWMGLPLLPQLNYRNKTVRKTIWGKGGVVRYWLQKPYYLDGWRFDVGNNTGRRGQDQLGHKIFRKVRKAVKKVNPRAYILAEHWTDPAPYLQGDQWDAVMNYFGCLRPLRAFLGERDRFVGGDEFPPRMAPPLSGQELADQLERHLSRLPGPLVHLQFNLLGSHDIHRLHHFDRSLPRELYEGVVAFQFCLPGTPSIYYGDEIGLGGGCQSVEQCRYPMVWDRSRWDRERFQFYQALIELRRRSLPLQRGAWAFLHAGEQEVALLRWYQREAVLMVLNRSAEARSLSLSVGRFALKNPQSWSFWANHTSLMVTTDQWELQLAPQRSVLLLCETEPPPS